MGWQKNGVLMGRHSLKTSRTWISGKSPRSPTRRSVFGTRSARGMRREIRRGRWIRCIELDTPLPTFTTLEKFPCHSGLDYPQAIFRIPKLLGAATRAEVIEVFSV